MTVDRDEWSQSFKTLPNWRCPKCAKGYLIQIDDKTWDEETEPSKADHDHPAWEPDWIRGRFATFLQCSNAKCKEMAVVSGTYTADFFEDHELQKQWSEQRLIPASIDPSPIPIRIPETTPPLVKQGIAEAAALVWLSAQATANQLRQAVEHLMDALSIPSKSAAGKTTNLHQRIETFKAIDPEVGEVLLATKWLGNSGSHIGGLSRDDVLNAFDMVEFVLDKLYGTEKKALLDMAASINAHKGPKPLDE